MYHRLKSFLGKNDILFKSQYCFREKHSTQHAIIDVVNVDHLILLQKLNHYGIRGIINDWCALYLLGRSQDPEVGFNLSTECMSSCRVPQGSVLGPLLFLFFWSSVILILRRNSHSFSLLMTRTCCMLTLI